MRSSERHISIALFCLYILAVGIACFIRPDSVPEYPFDWFGLPTDKIMHFIMFCPFPILAYNAFTTGNTDLKKASASMAAIILTGMMVSAVTEGVQFLLKYRSFEWTDLMADFSGIIAGALASLAIVTFRIRRTQR